MHRGDDAAQAQPLAEKKPFARRRVFTSEGVAGAFGLLPIILYGTVQFMSSLFCIFFSTGFVGLSLG
jgi:hypothetical protein